MAIQVTFWGVRGSIATPGPDTVQVGGNTSCVQVQCGERQVILDTGTGMRLLGQKLLAERKRAQLSVFYSHMHWDHIQGLPFFTPVYIPGTEIDFHGPKGLAPALNAQMSDPGFPVRFTDVPAKMTFSELTEGMVVRLDADTTVTCAKLATQAALSGLSPVACWRIGCSTKTTRSSTPRIPSTIAAPTRSWCGWRKARTC